VNRQKKKAKKKAGATHGVESVALNLAEFHQPNACAAANTSKLDISVTG